MRSFRHFSSTVSNFWKPLFTFCQHRLTISVIAVSVNIYIFCLFNIKTFRVTDAEMFLIGTDLYWKFTAREISLHPNRQQQEHIISLTARHSHAETDSAFTHQSPPCCSDFVTHSLTPICPNNLHSFCCCFFFSHTDFISETFLNFLRKFRFQLSKNAWTRSFTALAETF